MNLNVSDLNKIQTFVDAIDIDAAVHPCFRYQVELILINENFIL